MAAAMTAAMPTAVAATVTAAVAAAITAAVATAICRNQGHVGNGRVGAMGALDQAGIESLRRDAGGR
jgi:phage tail sheath gpL-like